jgi:hypothetical protein
MFLRSELLAAQSENNSSKEDSSAKLQSLNRLEKPLSKPQPLLFDSRQEAAGALRRVEMGGMVQRLTLELQLQDVENTVRSEGANQREVIQDLHMNAGDAASEVEINPMLVCKHVSFRKMITPLSHIGRKLH